VRRARADIKLEARTEQQYFANQISTARPIQFLAWFVAVIMAVGASFGAMNTMYVQVSARTREVATLRALGFSRGAVLASFVLESLALSLLGGLVGAAVSLDTVRWVLTRPVGTQNFATFSEILFHFHLTPALLGVGIAFALAMGLLGGILPAARAA
jgi:putative ABC transport system permease protein